MTVFSIGSRVYPVRASLCGVDGHANRSDIATVLQSRGKERKCCRSPADLTKYPVREAPQDSSGGI